MVLPKASRQEVADVIATAHTYAGMKTIDGAAACTSLVSRCESG